MRSLIFFDFDFADNCIALPVNKKRFVFCLNLESLFVFIFLERVINMVKDECLRMQRFSYQPKRQQILAKRRRGALRRKIDIKASVISDISDGRQEQISQICKVINNRLLSEELIEFILKDD